MQNRTFIYCIQVGKKMTFELNSNFFTTSLTASVSAKILTSEWTKRTAACA